MTVISSLVLFAVLLTACNIGAVQSVSGDVSACGGVVSMNADGTFTADVGTIVYTIGGITLHYEDGDPLKLNAGQFATVTELVTINPTAGTITGKVIPGVGTPPACVVAAAAIVPATMTPQPVSTELDFVLAHGAHFADYITPGRDYRELSVMDVYNALKAYGYEDTDFLVIAHSDEVREWQESRLLAKSFDAGKALIAVGEVKNLKSDKAFMLVSANVYDGPNDINGNPLEVFDPTPNE